MATLSLTMHDHHDLGNESNENENESEMKMNLMKSPRSVPSSPKILIKPVNLEDSPIKASPEVQKVHRPEISMKVPRSSRKALFQDLERSSLSIVDTRDQTQTQSQSQDQSQDPAQDQDQNKAQEGSHTDLSDTSAAVQLLSLRPEALRPEALRPEPLIPLKEQDDTPHPPIDHGNKEIPKIIPGLLKTSKKRKQGFFFLFF